MEKMVILTESREKLKLKKKIVLNILKKEENGDDQASPEND